MSTSIPTVGEPGPGYADKIIDTLESLGIAAKPYGVLGDGSDQTAALQAAIDDVATASTGEIEGGRLWLPPGVIRLTAPIEGAEQGVTLKGQGRGSGGRATIIKWDGPAGQPMFHNIDTAYVGLEDAVVLGDNANPPSAGIYFEEPTPASSGRNADAAIRRVIFGRHYAQKSSPDGAMERGIHFGGASITNNDQFSIEDVNVFDCSVAGLALDNTQSVWGMVRNLLVDSCAVGVYSRASTTFFNLKCNRNALDLDLSACRTWIFGYFSEHAEQLWQQRATTAGTSLMIEGGRILLHSDMTGTYWAESVVAVRNWLLLHGLNIEDVGASGSPTLHIVGSSSNTTPAWVHLDGNMLPNGDSDAGYTIDGYATGTPLHVEIRQGAYYRRQIVQELDAASAVDVEGPSRVWLGPFILDNVTGGGGSSNATLAGTTRNSIPVLRAGQATGIILRSNEARTAGSVTAAVTKTGAASPLTATLDAANPTVDTGYGEGLVTYAAGDMLGVQITPDASWDPDTADVQAWVEFLADA